MAMAKILGALPHVLPPRLAEWTHRAIRNTRGEIVGEVRAAMSQLPE